MAQYIVIKRGMTKSRLKRLRQITECIAERPMPALLHSGIWEVRGTLQQLREVEAFIYPARLRGTMEAETANE